MKDQILITKFIGPKPVPHEMESWLQTLHQKLRGDSLSLNICVGKGYFFLVYNKKKCNTKHMDVVFFSIPMGYVYALELGIMVKP